MGKRWFAKVERGIGWYPVTWQGWIISLLYAAFIIWDYMRLDKLFQTLSETVINFLPEAGIATVIFAFICYFTGEKPKV